MTADYQSLLQQQQSAPLLDITDKGRYLIPLPDYGVITVKGEEAGSFLQNLLTNDVTQLAPGKSQLTAMCNPKGRLLALFTLIQSDDGYQLVLPEKQCAFLAQRLQLFKLRSKVEIIDATSTLQVCGLSASTDAVKTIPFAAPPRALLIDAAEQLALSADQLLADGWQLAHKNSWQLADIKAGIANVFETSRELFTAQQLNLDLIGAVSFRKGCYPGQEVVARLHYLGEAKRRLFYAESHSTLLPNMGDTLVDSDNNVAGHIVNAVQDADNKLYLQLSLKLQNADQVLFLNDGSALQQITALAAA